MNYVVKTYRSSKLALVIVFARRMGNRISDHFSWCQKLWQVFILFGTISLHHHVGTVDSRSYIGGRIKRHSLLSYTTMARTLESQGKFNANNHFDIFINNIHVRLYFFNTSLILVLVYAIRQLLLKPS